MNDFLRKWFPNSAVWTAVFTGILTLFTYLEYRVSHATSEIQRNSERAFLAFSGPQIGVRLVGPTGPTLSMDAPWTGQEIAIDWSNNGETPARNATIKLGSGAFFPDIPQEFDYPLTTTIDVVVGPKSSYGSDLQVGRDIILDGFHGKKRLFIWGDATYDDVFENSPKRLTEFCVELTHLTAAMLGPQSSSPALSSTPTNASIIDVDSPNAAWVGMQWQQCRAHNCYDKDCPDYKSQTSLPK